MSKHGFTPGPWGVKPQSEQEADWNEVEVDIPHRRLFNDGDDAPYRYTPVATIEDLKEQHANARLIAAAPDLFKALEEIVEDIDDPDHEAGDWSQQVVVKNARAALAKAAQED